MATSAPRLKRLSPTAQTEIKNVRAIGQLIVGVVKKHKYALRARGFPITKWEVIVRRLLNSRIPDGLSSESGVRADDVVRSVHASAGKSALRLRRRAGGAVHLRDGRPGPLAGPAPAPVWLQGGVRQPASRQLRPRASRSRGEPLLLRASA